MRGTVVQTVFVWYWGHSHLATLALLSVVILYFAWTSRIRSTGSKIAYLTSPYWGAIDKALIALAIAHCALYLSMPNFADSGESIVPLLASNYLHGAPVYSDWSAGQAIVGSLYGPYVFLAQVPVLSWYPTIGASKLVGVFFGLGSLLLLFLAVRYRTRSVGDALAMCALMVGLLSFELHYWFWNRPDSILIAVVSLGVLLFDRARPIVCLAGLGLLAGVAINLKLFGAIYLLSLALASVPMVGSRRRLICAGAIGGGLFLTALALPFGAGFLSLRPYIANLSMMRNQGFVFGASMESMFYGLAILSLPLSMLWRRRIGREDRVMVITLAVCTVVVAVIAGKPGGGPPYMMPLIPLALYLTARLSTRQAVAPWSETATRATRRLVLCAVVICATPIWAYSWFQMVKQIPPLHTELAKARELRWLFSAFPGSEMGHNSGLDAEQDENYRVERAFLGQVTRFDYVNFADQRSAGLSASILYPLFEQCRVPSWILTRQGGRFLGTDMMGHALLLDEGAFDRFHANYELADQYRFYEVWRCSPHSNTVSAVERVAK